MDHGEQSKKRLQLQFHHQFHAEHNNTSAILRSVCSTVGFYLAVRGMVGHQLARLHGCGRGRMWCWHSQNDGRKHNCSRELWVGNHIK